MSLADWVAVGLAARQILQPQDPPTPGVISSADQMEALPVGARVQDRSGNVWVRYPQGWSSRPDGKHRHITARMLFHTIPRAFPGALLPPEENR